MHRRVLSFVASAFLATNALAETTSCKDSVVSVSGPLGLVERTCEATKHAEMLFAECNIPPLSRPVPIKIVEEVESGCVALFHCGKDVIEVLAPPEMQELRDLNGIFGFLPIATYFDSVIVHELVHAALDGMPCPVSSCVATHEYVAYSMQVLSLSPNERSEITEKSAYDRQISFDEINSAILALAPDEFKRRVWAHFSQQDDPCKTIEQITGGALFLDHEMP